MNKIKITKSEFKTKQPFYFIEKEIWEKIKEKSLKHTGKDYISYHTKKNLIPNIFRMIKEFNQYSSYWLYKTSVQPINDHCIIRISFRERADIMTNNIIEREISKTILEKRGFDLKDPFGHKEKWEKSTEEEKHKIIFNGLKNLSGGC